MNHAATRESRGERAVVIGAGVAGAAAAFAAERAGWSVTWVDGGFGASSMTSGALDLEPWEAFARALAITGEAALSESPAIEAARDFVDALGIWELPRGRVPTLATTAGIVRPTRGFDRAILDVSAMRGRTVLVPRVDRAGWDADWLARAWSEDPRGRGVSFEAVDAPVLRFDEESRVVDAEIAGRHDDPARLAWLADRLAPLVRARGRERCAILLGPWLGSALERATELRERLGVPVGEALSGTAGVAGLRFEAARSRACVGEIVRAPVARVEEDGSALRVVFAGERPSVRARAVVLATGGLVSGGVTFSPPTEGAGWDGADTVKPAFRLAVDAPGLEPSRLAGSLHGPALDETAWPRGGHPGVLETVGTALSSADSGGIRVVGDARKGAARTMLEAIRSGLEALGAVTRDAPPLEVVSARAAR